MLRPGGRGLLLLSSLKWHGCSQSRWGAPPPIPPKAHGAPTPFALQSTGRGCCIARLSPRTLGAR